MGSVFLEAPADNQWILVILATFAKEIFIKILLKITTKAAGSEENHLGKSTNILVLHFLSTKHAIFLSIIVGGLATPVTNYCIVAIDTVQAMLDGWKVVRKYRQCPSDAEGILKYLYCAYLHV